VEEGHIDDIQLVLVNPNINTDNNSGNYNNYVNAINNLPILQQRLQCLLHNCIFRKEEVHERYKQQQAYQQHEQEGLEQQWRALVEWYLNNV